MAHLLLTIMDHIYIVKGKILGERLNGGGGTARCFYIADTLFSNHNTLCFASPPHEMAEDGKRWRARLSASKICVFIRASALGGWQTRVGFRNRREIGRMGGR